MKKAKRCASLLLAFVLLFANMSFNVFATEVSAQAETEEYGQIILSPGEGTKLLTEDGKPLESILVTLEGQAGYWYKIGERLDFVIEVEPGYILMFESFNNAEQGGTIDYDFEKETYYGIVTAGENTIMTATAVDDAYVGKNAISSQDYWQEKIFSLMGFASVVGGSSDMYFEKGTEAPEGTVYWFLNSTYELQEWVNDEGYLDITYAHYMAIADAYFTNAPEMKEYLSERGYLDETGEQVHYYMGGLGDAWRWVVCEVAAYDGGYKLKGIFCSGEVTDTTGLTEYVDYYNGMYIDSAVELDVVNNEEHGWMIAAYSELDYYMVEDQDDMGQVLYVYNEDTDRFSDVYYAINIRQAEDKVKVVLEERTYTTINGIPCYSSDMTVKWKAVCEEGYTCQVKVKRTFAGETETGIAEKSGVVYGGGSVVLEPVPVPLFTFDVEHATVEVLQGLIDMEDGTYAYMDTAAIELKITPESGYEISEVASFLYDNYVVFGTYINASDSWVIYPEYLPSTIRVRAKEVIEDETEDIVTIVGGTDSGEKITIQVAAEDAKKFDGLTLVVEELAPEVKEEAATLIIEHLGETADKLYILDIFFENAQGEETEVDTTMVVTVPIPEGWDPANVAVYYVNEETGELVDMKAVVSADGKNVSFVTTHFSHYAFVQKSSDTADDTVMQPGETTPQPGATAPQTDDASSTVLWSIVMAVSLSAVFAIGKKRKYNM